MFPIPMTLAPFLAVAISAAIFSVFSALQGREVNARVTDGKFQIE